MQISLNAKKKIDSLLEDAFRAERQGRYKDSLDLLKPFWNPNSGFPDTEQLTDYQAASLLLRCGSVSGYLGNAKQIKDGQELGKDLLFNARNIFLSIGADEEVAECEVYLASAYQRNGFLSEAKTWLNEAYSHTFKPDSKTRLYAFIIEGLVDISEKNFAELIAKSKKIESAYRRYGDDFFKGCFQSNIGVALKRTGKTGEALACYEQALNYFCKAPNRHCYGATANDLSLLFSSIGRYTEAHECANKAMATFNDLGDLTREGFCRDTKALIFLAEKDYANALVEVELSIKQLEKGENYAYLTDSYLTKIKVLFSLGRRAEALMAMHHACKIAEEKISEKAFSYIINETEKLIEELTPPFIRRVFRQKTKGIGHAEGMDLKLLLPDSLPDSLEYFAVSLEDDSLSKRGLRKGVYVIVASQKLESGDLAAVCEGESEEVVFGVYEADLQLFSSEQDDEMEVYAEENVRVLGKVVGYCKAPKKNASQMRVYPL